MEVKRIFDLLSRYESKFEPKEDVVASKINKQWVKYDIKAFRENVDNISYGLMKLGIKKGDKIATISPNRPEWNFVDHAILQLGAVHVPIYPTISESDYKYILNNSETKYIFISGREIWRKIEHILPEIKNVKDVYSFNKTENLKHLSDLIAIGKANRDEKALEKVKAAVNTDDLATIIYTSGTTGDPKGVMLSHKNLLSNVEGVHHIFPVDQHCKAVSYLPMCHVYERTNIYVYMYLGVSIYYAENMGTIASDIQEIKPEILTTVPRLLEKVYDKILAKGRKLKGFKHQIFFWAVQLGEKYEYDISDPLYLFKLKIADKLVFSKWREALGGNLKAVISGGAAIQPRLKRVFNAAGIPTVEGYGMTESSPVIAVNTFSRKKRKIGTVGPPLENVQVKISEEGEILAKGPNIMLGYYKQPELTKQTVVDGWLHTGDMGKIDEDGMLKITGRLKEIFKTSMGKYVSPALIENKFKESPFIDQMIVLGENQKFAAALIVPDFEYLKQWSRLHNVKYNNNKQIIKEKIVVDRFKKDVAKYNKYFGDYEQVKKFELMDHEWSLETGEITANLKLKRRYITEKYKDKINGLFGIKE
jgi:long-chain acyl-CoA synthetase